MTQVINPETIDRSINPQQRSKLVEILEISETELDENNIKTRTTIGITENGDKIKLTEVVKVTKTTRRVRVDPEPESESESESEPEPVPRSHRIPRFGACAALPPGIDSNTTYLGEEVFIIPVFNNKNKDKNAVETIRDANVNVSENNVSGSACASGPVCTSITCNKCGGNHFTSMCNTTAIDMNGPKSSGKYVHPSKRYGASSHTSVQPEPEPASANSNKYVPPSRRNDSFDRSDGPPGIRISNLPEDITKDDLLELLNPFGSVGRIAIPNDKRTGLSRGFAFVNFYSVEDGQSAIDKLNGRGYNHLIIKLEWAKPKK